MIERKYDKFYTKFEIAYDICKKFKNVIFNYDFIVEPSVGSGVFIRALNKIGYDKKIISIDILPDYDKAIKSDFLKLKFNKKKNILIIGNPPFGKNSSLALKFLNKSKDIANEIIFILPDTFYKESIKNKLNGLELIDSYKLPINSFLFLGKDYNVPSSVFYFKVNKDKKYEIKMYKTDLIEFVSKDEADYAIRRVGALAGKVLDEFQNYSSSSNYFIKSSLEVKEFLKKHFNDLQQIAKLTAGNPSLSKNELKKFIIENFK